MRIWMKYLVIGWSIVSVGIVIVSSFASPVYAKVTVKDYKQAKEIKGIKESMKFYVVGLGVGFYWANIFIKRDRGKLLYCQPGELNLGADILSRILEDEIRRAETILGFQETQEALIEWLLLEGLINTFPCPQK